MSDSAPHDARHVPTLLLTGPVGVGKTSVLYEASEILTSRGVHHSAIDVDAITQVHPRPAHDRFGQALALRCLRALWDEHRAEGAERLLLARVVESWDGVAGFAEAVPGAAIIVVRLQAQPHELGRRVARREIGSALAWHVARARELAISLENAGVDHVRIPTDGRDVPSIAAQMLAAVGWTAPPARER